MSIPCVRSVLLALGVLVAAPAVLGAPTQAAASSAHAPASAAPAASAAPLGESSHCGTENRLAGATPFSQENVGGNLAHVTDGTVGPEGAAWDAPLAVTFSGPGSITYDLGQPEAISALFLQADANDTYKVSGSLDGSPSSFTPILELPNAFSRGHGLRSRAAQFASVTVRYLRVSEGIGDGAFSISELAAYCTPPQPFPPKFPSVAAPLAPTPLATSGPGAEPAEETGTSRSVLVVLAAVLAALGLMGTRAKPQKTKGKAKASNDEDEDDEAEEKQERAATTARVAMARQGWTEQAIRLMFLASGCAALIYEVVWFHLMRLVIGASAISVGIVLASFMGGMFLGSLLYTRYVPRDRHPLKVYAYFEIGIGIFGLLMPLVLPAVRFIYVGLVGYGALGIALRAVIAAILLLPPTALMGATLPAIARRYSGGRRGMSSLAALYAANTVGAVLGCLLSAFYLLAVWDVWVATSAAALLNFGVGAYGLRLARTTPEQVDAARPLPARVTAKMTDSLRAVYVVAALSGLTALGGQVIWTRLLTLLFGATVFAFAIILAVFLAGLGIGSALAAYLLRRGLSAVRGLAWSQILLVPALALSSFLLARILPYSSPGLSTPVAALHGVHVLRAIDVILPAAVLWGMSFPFALAAAGTAGGDTGRSSGLVYAANTVGAIVGALVVSFWAIPTYGTKWAEQFIVVLAGLSAAILFFAIRRSAAASKQASSGEPEAWEIPAAFALASGILAAAYLPGMPTAFLAHGRYIWWVDARDRYPYVSEGAASTVAVHIGADGYKNFHVSGRVEATNNPNDLRTERLIGHLSALPHPRPESVLVVGLGGGISAGTLSLYPEVKRIVICEIEPRVVGAARQFATENYSVLDDPRVEIVFDDARHFLATTREKFDVITSDPIHPWVRGNSMLFSREYYEIVKARLRPGGIATQWVPLYETSELAIKIQMRTFMAAFPRGTVWNTAVTGRGYDVVLVGGEAPLHIDVATTQRRIDASPRIADSLREVRIDNVADLLATYGASGPDMKAWLTGVPINRDFSLKLEYISGLALNAGEADPIYSHMVAGRTYPDFVATPEMQAELHRRLQLD